MGNVLVESSSLSAIANAIRNKNGSLDKYKPKDMAKAINDINTGSVPTGTKKISVTQNGTITENVSEFASAQITTNVPNSYSASDEGKVVSNGLLVGQTSAEYTSNNTYDTTLIDEVTVNVSGGITPTGTISITQNGTVDVTQYASASVNVSGGGGYTAADFADATKPEGAVVFEQVTFPSDTVYFAHRTNITSIFGTNYNETANRNNTFRAMTGLRYAVFPKWTRMYNTVFYDCTNLEAIDWLGGGTGGALIWANCYKLKTMVIRKSDGISVLSSNNAFNNTPFASGGSGGTIYIPKVLYDELGTGSSLDYKAATNWSTYDGYGTITWAQIEGSIYETQYVDGTPIPTT